MRQATLSFARTYLIALVVLMTLGIVALAFVRQAVERPGGFGAPRPTGAVLRPYSLDAQRGSAPPSTILVDPDGAACQRLTGSEFLATSCVLALNIDATFIAGEAFGRLNTEDTPSYEAMIWRATLSGDATVCDQGGLLGERLARCRIAAGKTSYTVARDGWTVTVTRSAGN